MDAADARRSLVVAARRLDDAGLNVNASGNLSVRTDHGVLVTPSGIAPARMEPDDCVLLDRSVRPIVDGGAAPRIPTSEWRLHLGIYADRPDVAAIVHTHSPEATAASTAARAIPAVHYVVARFGGTTLPCAAYATYGSPELASNVAATLGTHGLACLMANHGATTVAADLDVALSLAFDVEWLCAVYRKALAHGRPTVLDDDEIGRVAVQFRTYGQPGGDSDQIDAAP